MYADVARRLRGVCIALPPEEFDRLVRRICATKLRWGREDAAERE